uniref:Uncharacterized protein n=1 Tax=Anguilla anguilla TaxID=7936 RepID=A0A0E9SL97_ANGAN
MCMCKYVICEVKWAAVYRMS